MVESTPDGHVLLHAKDEIARLKALLKDYNTKESEVVFLCFFVILRPCCYILYDTIPYSTHSLHFNGHFTGESGLAGCPLGTVI